MSISHVSSTLKINPSSPSEHLEMASSRLHVSFGPWERSDRQSQPKTWAKTNMDPKACQSDPKTLRRSSNSGKKPPMAEIKNQASREIELLEMTENNSSNKQTSKSFNMIQVQKKKDSLEL